MRLIGLGLLLVVAGGVVVVLKVPPGQGQTAHLAVISSGSAVFEDVPLAGRRWHLTHINGVLIKTTKPYILLDSQAKRFEGDGGCNRMSGAAEANGSTIKFSRIISTKRACADRQLQQVETDFVQSLERTNSFYIRSDLMRFYANGVAILTFKAEAGQPTAKPSSRGLQPNSLCAGDEQIIFSCRVKRTLKLVSLCASQEFDQESGYLQYRFGLPGKVELEFPKGRQRTQGQFQYSHYLRYQVDLTEINFSVNGNQYQIFDAYNGEEKPVVNQQGLQVVPAKTGRKAVTYQCRSKPKADYSKLADALREH